MRSLTPSRRRLHRRADIAAAAAAALLVLLLAGDRLAAHLVTAQVADRLACAAGLAHPPAVVLGGIPFLTQALAGRYTDVEISARDVRRGDLTADSVQASLQDLTLPGPGLVHVARAAAEVTVAYSALPAQVLGRPVTYSASGGMLVLATTVSLADRPLPVSIVALLRLTGNDLAIVPREVELAGVYRPAGDLLDRLGGPGALSRSLPALPAGLRYRSVSATARGLRFSLDGTDLTVATSGCGASR